MNLLIVGAGGHGRCCLEIAREMNIFENISFLDDKLVNTIVNDAKVIGTIDEIYTCYETYTHICIAIGNNKVRQRLIQTAKEIGYTLPILKCKSSVISTYAEVGMGCVVFPNTVIEPNAVVKEGSIIASNSVINHDANLGECVLVNTSSVIRPNVLIEDLVMIESHCTITMNTKIKSKSIIEDGSVI